MIFSDALTTDTQLSDLCRGTQQYFLAVFQTISFISIPLIYTSYQLIDYLLIYDK